MNKYEVWSSGYIATGEPHAQVMFHGTWEGITFGDAFKTYCESMPDFNEKLMNVDNFTYWGIKHHPTSSEAHSEAARINCGKR